MTAQWTGRHVLLSLLAFFACVIAVNAYFVVASVVSFRGEDEQKPYLQGIEYNQTLDRREKQALLAWSASISVLRLDSGHVRVTVSLKDSAGRAKLGVPLSAEMRHPSDENRDRSLRLVASVPGQYTADAGTISAGAWDIVVNSASSSTPFEATRRVWVP